MKLDIVIPTLNEKENLRRIIPFLKRHSTTDTNIYVVDSVQSDDDIYEFCNTNGVSYIKSQFSRRSIQMNEGARSGNGDALLFLHADVTPPKDFNKIIQSTLTSGHNAGYFAYKFDAQSLLLKINSFFTQFNGIFSGGGDQCQFFTRELFEKYNGYKDEYEIMEDFEFIDRLKNNNEAIKLIKEHATVSARKYEKNSYLLVNYINLITFIKYKRNTNNHQLRNFYNKSLSSY